MTRPVTISGDVADDAKKHQEKAVQAAISGGYGMQESARYIKFVEWSEEDRRFAGSCPGLLYGGCHGHDEVAVFEQL